LFLPQIRWAGCNDFITTFARHEFGFTMKSNAHCRLAGWWVCSRQPMNGGIGRRWRSVTTGRWFKVSLFIFTSPVLPQICHWPVRKSHSFLAAIFSRHVYSKPSHEVCVTGYTRCLAEWPARQPVKSGLVTFTPPI